MNTRYISAFGKIVLVGLAVLLSMGSAQASSSGRFVAHSTLKPLPVSSQVAPVVQERVVRVSAPIQPTKPVAAVSAAPSVSGNIYPYGQCTWYAFSVTGRGQNGNAGTWRPSSSTPAVGKIMIWRPGQQGASGAGHVGVVIAVNGNSITIRHMNWGGGFGQVTTGTFQSTGLFY